MSPVEEFIRTFVSTERQDRYLSLASKPSRRSDFIWSLAHDGRHLERSLMQRISHSEAVPTKVHVLFKSLGAGNRCFVLAAAHSELDDCDAETITAFDAIVGKARDSIVFFPQVGLAYYENHEGESYVLRSRET